MYFGANFLSFRDIAGICEIDIIPRIVSRVGGCPVGLTITLCFNDLDQRGIAESGKADHCIAPRTRPAALANRFVKLIRESRAFARGIRELAITQIKSHTCSVNLTSYVSRLGLQMCMYICQFKLLSPSNRPIFESMEKEPL